MHDGRFLTLAEVIDHYSFGIQSHDNLSPALVGNDGFPVKFNFTDEEKLDLLAFLETLTDYDMLQDEKYSNRTRALSDRIARWRYRHRVCVFERRWCDDKLRDQ